MESFRDTHGDDSAQLANRVLSWARERGLEVAIGPGAKPGALLKLAGRFTLFTIAAEGRIVIYMGYLQRAAPFDEIGERRELKARLERIPLVEIDERRLDKYPSFPIGAIAAPAEFAQFTNTLDWVLDRVQ